MRRYISFFHVFFLASAVLEGHQSAKAQQASAAPSGQTPVPAVAQVKKAPDYSKEAVVFDKLITRIRDEADGTGVRETTARVRVLADAGVKQLAVLTFTYTASNQQIEIGYVRVIKPDGTVVATPDYNVQDMPADVTREAPMYSDIHQKHVAVKGLGVGDTLEYQVTERTIKPEVPGHFWLEYTFEKNLVVLDEQLEFDVPADKFVTVASADLQPAVTTEGGRKVYRWATSNLSRPDPDAPPKSTKNWKPSVQVTTFKSWEEVGGWYLALEKDQLAVTPAIQAKADALTKGLASEDDKIRAIFNSVALHTHYVGLDFGIGRYRPHPADDVLSNEYGDCKDMHTLLAALLKAEGIEAWPVLISSGRDLDAATPSPAQFDHVITVVPRGDKLTWMDSTEEVAPVGVLMGGLRDKQALAIPPDKPAHLERTPADLPFQQSARFDAAGKIDEKGEFTAHITQTYHGDSEMLMRAAFRAVPEAQWKEFVQRISNSTGFAGEVKTPEVSPVEETEKPLRFAYDYTREKYGEWEDRRISPPMPPVGWELMPGIKQTKPADDVDIGSPGEQLYTSAVQMPKGWTVFPPQGVDLKEDWAEYHSKYSFSNGTFTAERRLLFKKDKVPLGDWDKYVAFREAIYEDVIRMSGVGMPGVPSVLRGVSGVAMQFTGLDGGRVLAMAREIQPLKDAAANLEAESPVPADKLAAAETTCRDQVRKFEDATHDHAPESVDALSDAHKLALAWTCFGWAEVEKKDLATAEAYLRPAWKLSQMSLAGYELARVLEAKGEKSEAAHIYELAYVSDIGLNDLGLADVSELISAAYRHLTGNPIKATALASGQYNGSLRAELDKDIEMRGYVRATKLNGQALFAVAYENGKPPKAVLFNGDKALAPLALTLEARRFPVPLPPESKARLVREIRLICTQWGGCDAYMMLPGKIVIPVNSNVIEVAPPPSVPQGAKAAQVKVQQ